MSSVSRSKTSKYVGKTVAIGLLGSSVGTALISPAQADVDADISGGVTLIAQQFSFTPDSGDNGDFGSTLSVDLNIEKEVGDGKVTVYINHAEGYLPDNDPGVNSDFEGAANDGSDPGFSGTRVAEAKLEYPLTDALTGTIGKISPQGIFDGNEVANDQTRQFLGAPFVNNGTIAFPGHMAMHAYPGGVVGSFEMSDTVTLIGAIFEDAQDYAGVFKNNFVIGEADVKLELLDGETNVRVIYWKSDLSESNGIAVSADQTWEDYIFFARYGSVSLAATAGDDEIKTQISGGVQLPFADDYTVGIGYAISNPNVTSDEIAAETWLEAYIAMDLSEEIQIAADYQQIKNPGFAKGDSVTAIGGRIQIDF